MKNIHILPTDTKLIEDSIEEIDDNDDNEPSRLLLCIKSYTEYKNAPAEYSEKKGNFRLGKYANKMFYQPQHIYITNDEEIKEGDWFQVAVNVFVLPLFFI